MPDIRRLLPADAAAYRDLMLEGYARAPRAFTSTVEERKRLPLDWWAERLGEGPGADQLVLGAVEDGRLVGVVGLRPETRPRTRHKALLYGMYVRPEVAGRGVGRALVEALLERASAMPDLRVVRLTVAEGNLAARRLYESCGFRPFGTEPFANRLEDGRWISLLHMWRPVGPEDGIAADDTETADPPAGTQGGFTVVLEYNHGRPEEPDRGTVWMFAGDGTGDFETATPFEELNGWLRVAGPIDLDEADARHRRLVDLLRRGGAEVIDECVSD